MSHAGGEGTLHPRLLRVKLPRMKINAHLMALGTIQLSNPPAGVPVRQQSQVDSARQRSPRPEKLECWHWKFQNRASISRDKERSAKSSLHVEIDMFYGENTGIVGKSQFCQNFKCPLCVVCDGKAWGAISTNRDPSRVLNGALCSMRILTELF